MRKLLTSLFGILAFLGLMSSNALQAQCTNFNVTAQDSALNPCDTNRFVTANVQAGTAPFTFWWSNGQTGTSNSSNFSTIFIQNNSSTFGQLIVQDAAGCRDTVQFNFLVGQNLFTSQAPTITQPSCGLSNGSAHAYIYTSYNYFPSNAYSWSNGQTGQWITNVGAGVYNVSITTNSGCKFLAETITLTQSSSTPVVSLVSSTQPSCGQSNGTMGIIASGGATPYTYLWSNGNTSSFVGGLAAGTYGVTVTTANGCRAINSYVLNNSNNIGIAADTVRNPTCGLSNGTITYRATGGTAPYTYRWSNGQTGTTSASTSLYNLPIGTYGITMTSANGCVGTTSRTLTNTSGISVSFFSVTNASCGLNNGTIGIQATGGTAPYSFAWTGARTGNYITGLAPGTYFVTVTDANGCLTTSNRTISNITPTGSLTFVSIVNPSCAGGFSNGRIIAQRTGGTAPYTFVWTGGLTGNTLTGLSAGTYMVTGTDAVGCSISGSYILNSSTVNTLSVSIQDSTSACDTLHRLSAIVSGGAAPYTFMWSNGSTNQFLNNYYGNGIASVTVTSQGGCSRIASRTLTTPSLVISFVTQTSASCGQANGALGIAVSNGIAPYTYLWSNGATSNVLSNIPANTYAVTVTSANGCRGTASTIIFDANNLGGMIIDSSTIVCDTTRLLSVYLWSGTAPYTFAWSNGFTGQHNNSVSGGVGSIVYVTVTDAGGCRVVLQDTLEANSLGVYTYFNNPSCGQSNGSAGVQTFNGQAPFSYLWSNGATTSNTSGLGVGNHSVTVTDANGCRGTDAFYLSTITTIQASIADSSVSCDTIRRLVANPINGQAPFSYLWSNGVTTQNNNNYLTGQTAYVTITTANGCVGITSYRLNPIYSQLTSAFVQQTQCTASTGSVSVTGRAGWQYRWSTGASTATTSGLNTYSSIQNLSVGTYSLTVTTQNGCQFVRQFYVGMNQNCQSIISGYVYRVAQGGACQPNNTPCEFCFVRVFNGVNYQFVQTDRNGFYSYRTNRISTHQLVFGFTRTNNTFSVVCPTNNTISVSVASLTSTYPNNNFYVTINPRLDLSLTQGSNFPNPTAIHFQGGNVCNAGDSPANGTYVFNYGPRLNFLSGSTFQNGSVSATIGAVQNNPSTHSLTITFSNLAPYSCFSFSLNFRTDTTLVVGDTLCGNALVTMTNGTETNLVNNVYNRCLPVRASYDPNDKQVLNHTSGGTYEGGIYPSQTELKYQIRFQNTGTAPAQRVVIRDVLSADLLPNSISNIAMSHAGTFNIYDNELVAEFDNINLEPQSVSEELSQGFISFSIERNPNLPIGAHIDNSAAIYFDYNSPIITNTARTTIMQMVAVAETRAAEMSLQVMPNPFNDQLQVNYELEADSKVRLSLINALGETVLVVANTNQVAGNQQVSISTQDLGAGMYYLLIETEAGRFAQKVIKQ